MTRTLNISTLVLLLFTGCSTGNDPLTHDGTADEDRNTGSPGIDFESYLKTLDQIPLPLYHSTLGTLPDLSKDYDMIGFEKFKHSWASQPLGILYNDGGIVTLIDCSIGDVGLVPLLTTHDRKGNKIDSLGPYERSGFDMGYEAVEYVTINKDKMIIVIDSVTTYSFKDDYSSDIDETTRKLEVGLTKYTIGQNGRFKKSE